MITCGKILGEAKRRWVPTQEDNASLSVGLPLDCAHPEPSHCQHASAIGAASCFAAAARLSKSEQLSRLWKDS
jgi:hypothetical protein